MRVKLCGVADAASLRVVGTARPDAVGFVLAASVRQVSVDRLAELLGAVPSGVERWAVFRVPPADVLDALGQLPLTGIQTEATWDGAGLPEGLAWLKAHRDGPDLLDRLAADGWTGRPRTARRLADAFLVDSAAGGGSGTPADVGRAREAARLGPMLLAGGLRPDTVAEVVAQVRPWGVDVSSGIESAPAVKDADKVRAFVAAARQSA